MTLTVGEARAVPTLRPSRTHSAASGRSIATAKPTSRVLRAGPSQRLRAGALLVAAMAGAIGTNLVLGAPAPAVPAVAAVDVAAALAMDYGEDTAIAARAEISEQEAANRMQEVVASRAAREAEEARRAVLPVQGRLTSGFGSRWGGRHNGLDFAAPMYTQEVAAAAGVVVRAGPATGFGLAVYIQHENGDVTVYGHMDSIQVQAGDVVEAGDPIALLGNRGQSTGPHLHFEVHGGGINGPRLDPVAWLADRGVEIPG